MSDSRLQEIVTRAVVGRAERRLAWCHSFAADGIANVLGVRVGNATINVQEDDGDPVVELTVDCELWCSDGRRSKIVRTTARWDQRIPVEATGEVLGEQDVRVALISRARTSGVKVVDGDVRINLEADVGIELRGLTRLWIKTYSSKRAARHPRDESGDEDQLGAVASAENE